MGKEKGRVGVCVEARSEVCEKVREKVRKRGAGRGKR